MILISIIPLSTLVYFILKNRLNLFKYMKNVIWCSCRLFRVNDISATYHHFTIGAFLWIRRKTVTRNLCVNDTYRYTSGFHKSWPMRHIFINISDLYLCLLNGWLKTLSCLFWPKIHKFVWIGHLTFLHSFSVLILKRSNLYFQFVIQIQSK